MIPRTTHLNAATLRAAFTFAACATACATPTPVTPAPISADDTTKLRAALQGTCEVTGTQAPGGEIKKAFGLKFTFGPDVQLDGRNITMTSGPYRTLRVDDWSGNTLKLFLYDISETYYCTKS